MSIDNNKAIAEIVASREVVKFTEIETRKLAKERFNELKKEMIEEFKNHKVTQELVGKATASNTSGTLGGLKGQNLFTFIGFTSGEDPIAPILDLFDKFEFPKDAKRRLTVKNGKHYTYNIKFITAQDIFDVTPMPSWSGGRSWAQGIEEGIAGFGWLARAGKTPNARSFSGYAFQRKKRIRSGKFTNTKYISQIIKNYERKFEKI